MEDGTERLRLQSRDAAQRDQQDGYGGDQIEDTAAGAARQVERGGRDLLKSRRRDGKSQEPADCSQSCTWGPDRSTSAHYERVPDSAQGGPSTLQARQKAIKTKATYMERQDPAAKMPVYSQEDLAQRQERALAVRRAEHGRQVRGSQQRRAIVSPQQGGGDSEKGPPAPTSRRSRSKDPRLGPAGIEERAGRGAPGKATAKGIKAAEHIPGEPMKTTQRAAQAAQKAAVHSTQKTAQVTRMTARSAAVTAKSATRTVSAAAKGAAAAARSLAAAIAAGGWVVERVLSGGAGGMWGWIVSCPTACEIFLSYIRHFMAMRGLLGKRRKVKEREGGKEEGRGGGELWRGGRRVKEGGQGGEAPGGVSWGRVTLS